MDLLPEDFALSPDAAPLLCFSYAFQILQEPNRTNALEYSRLLNRKYLGDPYVSLHPSADNLVSFPARIPIITVCVAKRSPLGALATTKTDATPPLTPSHRPSISLRVWARRQSGPARYECATMGFTVQEVNRRPSAVIVQYRLVARLTAAAGTATLRDPGGVAGRRQTPSPPRERFCSRILSQRRC